MRRMRQAMPFARKKRVAKPKRRGRKKGRGRFSYRRKPTPEEVDEVKEAPLECCPDCGGALVERKEHEQFVIDIPKVKPVVTRYVTQSGYCPCCGKRVRSRHPEQTSAATGEGINGYDTDGVLIGPRAKVLVADLKHRLGLAYGKARALVEDLFGLQVTRSGWYQAGVRLAEKARPVYEELVEVLRGSAVVHSDKTGWRIGTLSAWLWVFTSKEVTVYTIRRSRGHEVVLRMLNVTALLREALQLKAEKADLPAEVFEERAAGLERRLDALIAERRRFSDPRQQAVCPTIAQATAPPVTVPLRRWSGGDQQPG